MTEAAESMSCPPIHTLTDGSFLTLAADLVSVLGGDVRAD
jgi:hypothetical protein